MEIVVVRHAVKLHFMVDIAARLRLKAQQDNTYICNKLARIVQAIGVQDLPLEKKCTSNLPPLGR